MKDTLTIYSDYSYHHHHGVTHPPRYHASLNGVSMPVWKALEKAEANTENVVIIPNEIREFAREEKRRTLDTSERLALALEEAMDWNWLSADADTIPKWMEETLDEYRKEHPKA